MRTVLQNEHCTVNDHARMRRFGQKVANSSASQYPRLRARRLTAIQAGARAHVRKVDADGERVRALVQSAQFEQFHTGPREGEFGESLVLCNDRCICERRTHTQHDTLAAARTRFSSSNTQV